MYNTWDSVPAELAASCITLKLKRYIPYMLDQLLNVSFCWKRRQEGPLGPLFQERRLLAPDNLVCHQKLFSPELCHEKVFVKH